MRLAVSDIVGLSGIPETNRGVRDWLKRLAIPVQQEGKRFTFALSDLPAEVRSAWLDRTAEEQGLEPGTYDEAAHAALLEATPAVRDRADKKAAIVRFLVARLKAGMKRAEAHAAVRDTFGEEFTSAASLDRMEARVAGVDPVNYAPALMDGYCRDGAPRVEIPTEAWTLFEGIVKGAFNTHRITAAYNDVAELAKRKGQPWPSISTIMRRFRELPLAEQLALRFGEEEARKRLYQAQRRDTSGLRAMQWVALDGRTVDVWVRWSDGSVIRPTVLGLVDVASGKVLGIEIARSENAQALAALERRVFKRFGAPDNLLTDNGAAFSGHIHAGRVAHKHRNKGSRRIDQEPPGLHMLLGFKLHFALPKNAQAKLMERKFADQSREIDTCPEFMGAHAGSHPGERPEGTITPVELVDFASVYHRRLAAYNARTGRRSQGCLESKTSSYDAAFAALSEGRIFRPINDFQLRLATMEWTLSTVQRDGRVRGKDGWLYGVDLDDGSQDKLLRFEGAELWVGTDPLDRSKPALVWDPATDEIVMDGVHAVIAGKYDDAEGARRAARARQLVRKQVKRVAQIDAEAARAELSGIYQDLLDRDEPDAASVVAPNFNQPIRRASGGDAKGDVTDLPKRQGGVPEEYLRNQAIARAKRAQERRL
jgi:putative transposase